MKGIAIQTILLLLIGVLVVGILVYLVYKYTTSSTTMSTTECMSIVTNWCTTCMISGWSTSVGTIADTSPEVVCGNKLLGGGWTDNDNCGTCPTQADCRTDCCNTVRVGC